VGPISTGVTPAYFDGHAETSISAATAMGSCLMRDIITQIERQAKSVFHRRRSCGALGPQPVNYRTCFDNGLLPPPIIDGRFAMLM